MLAELRPAPFDVAGRSRELGNNSWDLERRAVLQPDLPDHVAGQVLRIARDVGHAVDFAARHLGRVERSNDLVGIVRRSPLADHGIELLAALGASRVVGKRRVVRQILPPDHLHQALEDAVGVGPDHDMLGVARQIGVGRHDAGQVAPGALARFPEKVVLRQRPFHHVEHRLVQRHIDHLAPARTAAAVRVAVVQSHHHADHPMQGGERVSDRQVRTHRRPIGKTGHVTQPAHRFPDRAESGQVAVRPGLPESGKPQHDQAGIFRREPFVAQSPLLQRPGPEVLDDDVCVPRDPANDLLPFGCAKVDGHRLLVAVLHVPPEGGAPVQLSPFAKGIALGRLDLDDFGAELGEEFPGKGSGNQLSQLDHLQPFQGLCHSSLRSTKACARVPVSTYSSSPPTGTPRAIRVTRRSRSLSISLM